MNSRKQVAKYILFDVVSAASAWILFFLYRRDVAISLNMESAPAVDDANFWLGIFILPLFWLSLYFITGFYNNIFRKSRLLELGQTTISTLLGVTVIFFVLILDDSFVNYKYYYNSYFVILTLHFSITYLFRLILTTQTIHQIQNRKIGFNTLIIGSNERAVKIYNEMIGAARTSGNIFVGFVKVENKENYMLSEHLPLLGNLDDLSTIIKQHNVEEIIIAIETSEHNRIQKIIASIDNWNLTVKAIPDMFDILAGTVKTSTIYTSPLVKISNGLMPAWQENVKRLIDITFSFLAIIVFLPFLPIIIFGIKSSSKGGIIYKQTRIGRYGKKFTIYKFRSMFTNAEKDGPALSSHNDNRITPFGQFMRRTHIDEIPQFYNVIKGDMSLVGPRPERQVYIDQIMEQAPHYSQLRRIRPGITSWGQVKYGYASNVDQMIERLPYDIIYLKNISIYLDFKILIYTLLNCFHGKGK